MPDQTAKVYANGLFLKNQTISGQNGDYDILKMRVNADKFAEFLNTHKNEAGFVNVDIRARKDVGQFGDTHYAVLNTYVPKTADADAGDAPKTATKQPAPKPKAKAAPVAAAEEDDIPF